MFFPRIRSLFCGSVIAFATCAGAGPVLAESLYDGLWNVTIVTKSGACEPLARYPLTVTDGRVSAAGAGVSGTVGREGNVRVSIGPAHANGQLSSNSGSGRWSGASGGIPCSGRWEASRQ